MQSALVLNPDEAGGATTDAKKDGGCESGFSEVCKLDRLHPVEQSAQGSEVGQETVCLGGAQKVSIWAVNQLVVAVAIMIDNSCLGLQHGQVYLYIGKMYSRVFSMFKLEFVFPGYGD